MVDIREYLREFIRQERDILLGLSVDITGLFAGFTATLLLPYLSKVEWILLVIPILLTVRGAVNGVFSGRLTTSLHLGVIYPHLYKNTIEYYSLLASVFFLGIMNGLIASFIIGIYLWDPTKFLISSIVIVTLFFIATTFSLLVTSLVGFLAFRSGLDPDVIVYPIMSTTNDVFGSLFLLVVIILLEPWNPINCLIRGAPVIALVALLLAIILKKYWEMSVFRKTLTESYMGVIFSLILSSLAGYVLSLLKDKIIIFPGILVALPAMMDTIGDVGSIIASTITTKLHIGEIMPDYTSKNFLRILIQQSLPVILPMIFLVLLYAGLASFMTRLSLVDFPFLLMIYSITGIIAYCAISVLALAIAIITFRYGIDPDNVSIPIITATADLLTVTTVYLIVSV
ncbi:MAG: magnesium transporter [Candidatus Njordarchaeales archaeon]